MYKNYKKLYKSYLKRCKKKQYLKEFAWGKCSEEEEREVFEELAYCCEESERDKAALMGMLDLMCACGKITQKKARKEVCRIVKNFSTMTLYGVYLKRGELCGVIEPGKKDISFADLLEFVENIEE